MTFTDNGTRVPWEWMPQAMASGVEHGAKRTMCGLGNLYRARRAPMRWAFYWVGWAVGQIFRPVWAIAAVLLCLVSFPALAGDYPIELSAGGSYSDTEGVGATAALSAEGLAKLGPAVAGPAVEFRYSDPEHGKSTTGTGFGAALELRIGKAKLRPFFGGQYLYWTGDVAQDHSLSLRGGIITGGEGAFLKVYATRERAFGKRDIDTNGASAAIGWRF